MNQNQTTTLGALLEMQPGDQQNKVWLNEGFDALVSNVASRPTSRGAPMITCWLSDPDNDQIGIGAKLFGRRAFNFEGQVCAFSGQGMSLGEYNGRSELTIGEKTLVQAIGQQGPPQRQAGPPARSGPPPASNPPPPQNRAPAGNGKPPGAIFGATVGMAVNNACAMALAEWENASDAVIGTPDYWRRVWEHASAILRIAAVLEKGKLAPNLRLQEDTNTGVDLSPEEQARADAEAQAEADRQEAASRQPPPPRQAAVPGNTRYENAARQRPVPGLGGSVAIDPDEDSIPF
jgi:hypothetical protein